MNQQDATRIKVLGLDALKDPDPNLRKEALLELRQYDTSIINEVLERVIQKDRDKEVRDLAQNLLTKRHIQAAQRPPKAKAAASSHAASETWTCHFCGSAVNDPQRCPHCGAERKADGDSLGAKMAVDFDTFLLNPVHRDFVLGKSKFLKRNGLLNKGCITVFGSMFVLFGVFFLVGMLKETYDWFIINQRGVATTAQYTNRHISSDDDSDDYFVSFTYAHNGVDYAREQRVSQEVYNRAEPGGRVQIVYVPTNPHIAKVEGTNAAPTAMLLFVLVWNSFVWIIIFFVVRQHQRTKFLERNGKMISGEILESTHSTDSDGDLSLKVEYTFQPPESDKRLSKVERAQRNDLKGKRPPAPGTRVVILYYNEQRYMLL